MSKTMAIIFGLLMVAVGILGFVPQISPNGFLFGFFSVNLTYNWVHIFTGLVSLLCAINGDEAARKFFKTFGVIYAIFAIAGFFYGESPIFGVVSISLADSILHTLFAIIFLVLGFGCCCSGSCEIKGPTPPASSEQEKSKKEKG